MEKNRLEAFSDGVLAIIITIMVLELKQPAGDSIKDFLALMPTLLAYLLSFVFIAIYWVNHHHIFHKIEQVNVKILWANIAWLFIMSFIPFATAWVGSHPTSWAPLSVYFADMTLACMETKNDPAVTFINNVHDADVWILPQTEANLKTTVWGTATLSKTIKGESSQVPLCEPGDDGQYIFRMIDTDHFFYSANSLILEAGWSLEIKGDDLHSVTIEVSDENGELQNTYEVFAARL